MKDFSLFYGPARGWLPVLVIAAVALVVVLNSGSADSEPPCVGVACQAPVAGELLVDGDVDVVPTSSEPDETDRSTVDWERTGRTGGDVPFVSLQPSSDGLTEAGEELVRSLGEGDSDGDGG